MIPMENPIYLLRQILQLLGPYETLVIGLVFMGWLLGYRVSHKDKIAERQRRPFRRNSDRVLRESSIAFMSLGQIDRRARLYVLDESKWAFSVVGDPALVEAVRQMVIDMVNAQRALLDPETD